MGNLVEDIRSLAATATAIKYKVYQKTIVGNAPMTDANNVIDIGADLKTLYGYSVRVPANAGHIYANADVQIKFNSLDNDQFNLDISEYGKIYTLNRGDLLIDKLYLGSNIPSGSAPTVTVQVFLSGSPL